VAQAAHEEIAELFAAMTPQARAQAIATKARLDTHTARMRERLLADPIPTTTIADFRAWQRRQPD
jgi:hypothetical protein